MIFLKLRKKVLAATLILTNVLMKVLIVFTQVSVVVGLLYKKNLRKKL